MVQQYLIRVNVVMEDYIGKIIDSLSSTFMTYVLYLDLLQLRSDRRCAINYTAGVLLVNSLASGYFSVNKRLVF